jgi:hypothetical protein
MAISAVLEPLVIVALLAGEPLSTAIHARPVHAPLRPPRTLAADAPIHGRMLNPL